MELSTSLSARTCRPTCSCCASSSSSTSCSLTAACFSRYFTCCRDVRRLRSMVVTITTLLLLDPLHYVYCQQKDAKRGKSNPRKRQNARAIMAWWRLAMEGWRRCAGAARLRKRTAHSIGELKKSSARALELCALRSRTDGIKWISVTGDQSRETCSQTTKRNNQPPTTTNNETTMTVSVLIHLRSPPPHNIAHP
jgi:hypothetical protein